MTETLHDSRPVIRCRSTADFLAALPHLAGFTASNSMFVVCFSGARSAQAIRTDLPDSEDPHDSLALLDFLSTLARDVQLSSGAPCALAIVITTEQAFGGGEAPWHRLARRIERRLRRERVPVRELCVLAADGWVSFLDPRPPRGGRPLSDIEQSPIAEEMRRHGTEPEALAELGAIPEAEAHRAAAVAHALERYALADPPAPESDPPLSPGAGNLADRALEWMRETAAVGHALRGEAELDADGTARLIRCTTNSDRWLVLAMGVLTRPDFPVELGYEHPLGNFSGIPVDLEIDRGISTRERSGDRAQRRNAAMTAAGWVANCEHGPLDPDGVCRSGLHAPPPGWSIFRLLASICPEFTDQSRLRPLRQRLLLAISECPRELRPGLLAFSAWIWWLGGSQTVAHRHLDAALEIDDAHELSLMLRRLTDRPLYERLISAAPPTEGLPFERAAGVA